MEIKDRISPGGGEERYSPTSSRSWPSTRPWPKVAVFLGGVSRRPLGRGHQKIRRWIAPCGPGPGNADPPDRRNHPASGPGNAWLTTSCLKCPSPPRSTDCQCGVVPTLSVLGWVCFRLRVLCFGVSRGRRQDRSPAEDSSSHACGAAACGEGPIRASPMLLNRARPGASCWASLRTGLNPRCSRFSFGPGGSPKAWPGNSVRQDPRSSPPNPRPTAGARCQNRTPTPR